MVAEKTSIAETVSFILSDGCARKLPRNGKGGAPIFRYDGNLFGESCEFLVTATNGHVYSLDFPSEYNDWNKISPKDLFAAPTVHCYDPRSNLPAHLAEVALGCHALILWLDCDREGENICFEVIRCTQDSMDISFQFPDAYNGYIYRAQFSSLAEQDIRAAWETLGKPNENMSLSVDARQELDLRIGVVFSRFQTSFFRKHFQNQLGKKMVTYGPCQTPTVWFVVQRHDEIQQFKPKPYWEVYAEFQTASGKLSTQCEFGIAGQQVDTFWDEDEFQSYFATLQSSNHTAEVTDVEIWNSAHERPLPLNTVQLLKVASSKYGIDPASTMHMAEQLYLKGVISYPRTETTRYADGFDLHETVDMLTSIGSAFQDWGLHVSGNNVFEPGPQRSDGMDVGDHPPITPMKLLTKDHNFWPVYEIVATNFLESLSPDAIYEMHGAKIDIRNGGIRVAECHAKYGRLKQRGWTAGAGYVQLNEAFGDSQVASLQMRDVLSFCPEPFTSKRLETKPPRHLTESELLGLMEQHGIGTDASMATHVSNVTKRGYVEIDGPSRELTPSGLGLALVHAFMHIDPYMAMPSVRSYIEQMCSEVAAGTRSKEEVLSTVITLFSRCYDGFVRNIYFMPLMLAAALSSERKGGTLADSLWEQAEKQTAEVDLNEILKLKEMGKPQLPGQKIEEQTEEETSEHISKWVGVAQEVLENLGFGSAKKIDKPKGKTKSERDGKKREDKNKSGTTSDPPSNSNRTSKNSLASLEAVAREQFEHPHPGKNEKQKQEQRQQEKLNREAKEERRRIQEENRKRNEQKKDKRAKWQNNVHQADGISGFAPPPEIQKIHAESSHNSSVIIPEYSNFSHAPSPPDSRPFTPDRPFTPPPPPIGGRSQPANFKGGGKHYTQLQGYNSKGGKGKNWYSHTYGNYKGKGKGGKNNYFNGQESMPWLTGQFPFTMGGDRPVLDPSTNRWYYPK